MTFKDLWEARLDRFAAAPSRPTFLVTADGA